MIAPAAENRRSLLSIRRGLMISLFVAALVGLAVWLFVELIPPNSRNIALRTIAVGIVANVCCALVGTYLVLRRMSLLGDAISHAVLPGIALAVLFAGSVDGWPVLAGAMIFGVITAFTAQSLQGFGQVSEDSSLGVVYTSLFALGVIILQIWAPHGHLDVDCVLFGAIQNTGLYPPVPWLGIGWPPAVLKLLPVLGIVLALIIVGWKELQLVAFDPALARAMGLPARGIHLALMGVVAMVTVASFESVGSILVVPMLIAPAATARMLVDRLSTTLVVAAISAAFSAVFGYLAAHAFDTSVAGLMAAVAGLQLGLAVLFSPRHGVLSRWLRNLLLAVQIAAEDIIARLYREEERGVKATAETHSPGWLVALLAVIHARRQGWTSAGPQLTTQGRQQAQSIVRAHRLWESYLATHFDLPRDHLHAPAERMEHFLDLELQKQLAAELVGRDLDPHGAPIPLHGLGKEDETK
ncbi:Manganese transport system membrane protein MntB [Anatilimnocola aggregata]|uniref:Manganese transport system membrane protein MntB n=1 Tax=Anatilimnocola aggregata TaxID=2528021 RepID=A0A517YBM2_9BACT|nr:metal ABC transporter permease [Anatilimnocola aggregata]QDU27635.1 Manganese transport system membrane protein MntB [Anatilimnocola aggregata]